MRGLIKKLIIWALSEADGKNRPMQEQSKDLDNSWKEWQGTRLNNLETNVRLIMNHLGVWVTQEPRIVKRGESGSAIGGTTSPSQATANLSPEA